MADFRRWFIALAVLALTAGLACAQVGSITSSTPAGTLTCTGNAASTPQLRSEGYTELLGDILISCTGFSSGYPTVGSQIPTTNITVYVVPQNIPITSRLFTGNHGSTTTGVSEVLLIIDEAGSGDSTGAIGGYGPKAAQTFCADTQTAGGCPAYVGLDTSGGYYVATGSSSTIPGGGANAANVYQGNVAQAGTSSANSVTFYGVPVLAPISSGVSRTFRVTNLRIPIPGMGLGNQSQVQVYVSTSPSTILPVSLASLQVGIVVDPGLKTSVLAYAGGTAKSSNPLSAFPQCVPQTTSPFSPTVDLVYTEGFATAFKTRMVPLTNALWAAQNSGNNLTGQNIPGGTYGALAANSESGFIFSGLTGTGADGNTYTAGLADFGTRLKAVFTNIPAGITLYVSGANKESYDFTNHVQKVTVPGGTSTSSLAVLITPTSSTSGVSETGGDGTNFVPRSSTYATPASPATTPQTDVPTQISVTPNSSGVATAIWQVVNSSPSQVETFTFTVYIGYPTNTASTTTAYGLPGVTNIPGTPVSNVSLMFAPEYDGYTSAVGTAAAAILPGTNPIPRFAIQHPATCGNDNCQAPFVSISLCQTTLLYPFVTANPTGALGQGFDTGIAVANTSVDPFTALLIPTTPSAGTNAETGSCNLYPYGISLSSTGVPSAAPSPLLGCDAITSPVPGTNCFPKVVPGSVQTVLASTVFPTFQGYVIAVCNFQYAHGYAALTDLGLRGIFSSYLAIELNYNGCGFGGFFSTTGTNNGTVCPGGQPRGTSIEFNSH